MAASGTRWVTGVDGGWIAVFGGRLRGRGDRTSECIGHLVGNPRTTCMGIAGGRNP